MAGFVGKAAVATHLQLTCVFGMPDYSELVEQVKEITNTSEDLAWYLLKATYWDLQISISTCLEDFEDSLANDDDGSGDRIIPW